MDKLKASIEEGITQITEIRDKLNEIYRSTQHRQMRDYMKEGIGQYLTSVEKTLETSKKALSSGDTSSIKQVADEMKGKILQETSRINRQRTELITQFELDS